MFITATPKGVDADNWGFGTDDLDSELAGVAYGAQVSWVREQVANYDVGSERLRNTFSVARSEAPRSAAILMFALAEDLMLSGLKQHLRGEVQGGWDEVSSGHGLLATANDRITLLALLGWIHPTVYADLRVLKSIRNRFAHYPDAIGFDDNKVRSYIATLSPSERALLQHMGIGADSAITPRQRYLLRAGSTLTRLVVNLAVAPLARQYNVAPGHIDGVGWEELPFNLREPFVIFGGHAMAVMRSAPGA